LFCVRALDVNDTDTGDCSDLDQMTCITGTGSDLTRKLTAILAPNDNKLSRGSQITTKDQPRVFSQDSLLYILKTI
jgi:hypothetical protein